MSSETPNLQQIMKEIEIKTEKKVDNLLFSKPPLEESKNGADAKTVGDILVNIMNEGAEEFKQKTGRRMTYSEMRQMYG